jgi:DNA-binding MarR family transcriptional regulator
MPEQTTNAPSNCSLNARQQSALRMISEQAAIPIDQLARFLGADLGETSLLVEQLKADRVAKTKLFYENDSPWVWLTSKGASMAGTGLPQVRPPLHWSLRHRRAVNRVRLHLEEREPQGRWISETRLHGRNAPGTQVPDGVFEVDGERHAIEVELSAKSKRHYRQLFAESCARYDAVVYFCAPVTARVLHRLKEEGSWPNLILRDLPRFPNERKRSPHRKAKRLPIAEELPILRLISEQGAVRIDQLGRFLDVSLAEVERTVTELIEANFLSRQCGLLGEPDWLNLTLVGNNLAGTSLSLFKATGGAVKRWHALNELRLYVAARAPQAQWISRRVLLRQHGRTAKVPGAEVRFDGKCYAFNIRLTGFNSCTLVPHIDLQNDVYDAVLFFCETLPSRVAMERLQEQHRWTNVAIRDMPKPYGYAAKPRSVDHLVDSLLGP